MALGCSLQTLSHLSDIIGPRDSLIGIIDKVHGRRPPPEEMRRFFKHHPRVSVIVEDVQTASQHRYDCHLALPSVSKYAFLMGLSSRLGCRSALQILAKAHEP